MRLHTPIANAVEVYKKRYLRDRHANYEHVWRLVHLQEALIVTVGVLSASRYLKRLKDSSQTTNLEARNKLRSLVTGYSDDPEDFNRRKPLSESCLSGSLGAWVAFLGWFARRNDDIDDSVLVAAREYLNSKSELSDQFATAFRSINPGSQAYTGQIPRVRKFEAINAMRNKLAHVPLPYDLIEPLHMGLRRELFSAILKDYDCTKDNIDSHQFYDILVGQIIGTEFILEGANVHRENKSSWKPGAGQLLVESQTAKDDPWIISPFLHVDDVLNVSLLFRAPDYESGEEIFRVEYHRFAAEARAVREEKIPNTSFADWELESLPEETEELQAIESDIEVNTIQNEPETDRTEPKSPIDSQQAEPRPPLSLDEKSNSALLHHSAISAFQRRNYRDSLRYFDYLENDKKHYNEAAALKHGQAALRLGVEQTGDPEEKKELFNRAETLLKKAQKHRDPKYQSYALYELSKLEYRRAQLTDDPSDHFKKSKQYIEEAIRTNSDSKYPTWREYLQEKTSDQ